MVKIIIMIIFGQNLGAVLFNKIIARLLKDYGFIQLSKTNQWISFHFNYNVMGKKCT